jgi:hypothetical protein
MSKNGRYCTRHLQLRGKVMSNEQDKQRDQDMAIFNFDVDDAAVELAATGVGTIPTGSVNIVPPNCCVQQKQ